MNIYVGNLPYDASNEQLRKAFEPHGQVSDARVVKDERSGRPLKFGFVKMVKDNEARVAIKALNGITAQGRTIVVEKSSQDGSGQRFDADSPTSTYRHLMSACQLLLGWLRGDFRVTTIWLCTIGALPRTGTENEKRYRASVIYCFVQTQTKKQAIELAETMVDENGWIADSMGDCSSVTRSTVPSRLVRYYKLARSEGDSIVEFPESIRLAATS